MVANTEIGLTLAPIQKMSKSFLEPTSKKLLRQTEFKMHFMSISYKHGVTFKTEMLYGRETISTLHQILILEIRNSDQRV